MSYQKYDWRDKEFSQEIYDQFRALGWKEDDYIQRAFDYLITKNKDANKELGDELQHPLWDYIDHPQSFIRNRERVLVAHIYGLEWKYAYKSEPERNEDFEEDKREYQDAAERFGIDVEFPDMPSWYYPKQATLVIWKRKTKDDALRHASVERDGQGVVL